MLPDRVLNPGPLTYESGALPTALRGPANVGYVKDAKINKVNLQTALIQIRRLIMSYLIKINTLCPLDLVFCI